MGRFFDLVNDPVHALSEYSSAMPVTAAQTDSTSAALVKLNANESPYGPSPGAVAAMRAALDSSNWYPDDHSITLRQHLAKAHGVTPQQVLIANGTTSLLGVIARTLLGPGRNAITSACSFISYPVVTRAAGATLVETPPLQGGYDLDAIAAAIEPDTRLVFLANPNNPTGTLVDAAALERFLDQMPAQVIVVLDEAYYDYAHYFAAQRGIEYSRSLSYPRDERNVVVLRTFSKAHGLAGIRVGYGQSHSLAAEISKLGYPVIPTWTNFVCIDVGQDAREVARKLRGERVLIRPLGAWGAPTSVRVTVGTAEQNQIFLHALQKISS